MEVYLNLAETGIGTYGVSAGSERYFGHDASAMTTTEAARLAAILPLPKKRGAIAPQGFTRRYGNTIAARIGSVAATVSTHASIPGLRRRRRKHRRRSRPSRGLSQARNMKRPIRRLPSSNRQRNPSRSRPPR
jgi:hypothetical protein